MNIMYATCYVYTYILYMRGIFHERTSTATDRADVSDPSITSSSDPQKRVTVAIKSSGAGSAVYKTGDFVVELLERCAEGMEMHRIS